MKKELYVIVKKSPVSNYLVVDDKFFKEDLKGKYQYECEILTKWGHENKIRNIDSFKEDFLLINVEYDGRKKEITDEDVFMTMLKDELVERKGESMFGGFYLATDKLNNQYTVKNVRQVNLINKIERVIKMEKNAFVQMKNGKFIKATIDGIHVNTITEEEKIKNLFRYQKIKLDERKQENNNHYRNVTFGK